MEYLGKTVRLNNEFVAHKSKLDEDDQYKVGVVIDQISLNGNRCLLVVDDPMYGTWKAINSNVEEVETSFDTMGSNPTAH